MRLKSLVILLVEDCPDQQRLLRHVLECEGATVYLECDGFAAVRSVVKAIHAGRPFDAVIMDLVLESSDGIESTRSIMDLHSNTPVVAITANGTPEIEAEWRRAGCLAYLEKPLKASDLISALRLAIDISKTFGLSESLAIEILKKPTKMSPQENAEPAAGTPLPPTTNTGRQFEFSPLTFR